MQLKLYRNYTQAQCAMFISELLGDAQNSQIPPNEMLRCDKLYLNTNISPSKFAYFQYWYSRINTANVSRCYFSDTYTVGYEKFTSNSSSA